jgi:predicted transposase/invertase (TIGR01784 family)
LEKEQIVQTSLSQIITATEGKSQYDASCKKLLSHKMILAWILKSCVEEFRDCEIEDIAELYIEGTPMLSEARVHRDEKKESPEALQNQGIEDTSLEEGTVTYDIRFSAHAPTLDGSVKVLINLEAQNNFDPGYPLSMRGVYYGCRMISAQYGQEFKHSEYDKIKKVYSIWVCPNPKKEQRKNTITCYEMRERNLLGEVETPRHEYDLINVIMICLGDANDEAAEEEAGILRLLEVLLSPERASIDKKTILKNEYHIPMTKAMEREVDNMCNLSDGVEQLGIEKGIAIGIEQGMERGIEQGGRKKLLQQVSKKLEKDQSIEQIADDLCEEVDVIESLVQELKQADNTI